MTLPGAQQVDGPLYQSEGEDQVRIAMRPHSPSILTTPNDDDDEPSVPEVLTLEARLVEDEPVYNALAVPSNSPEPEQPESASTVETNGTKTEQTTVCIWRYAIVLCLLAVIGLAVYFFVDEMAPKSGLRPCTQVDCEVSTWESYTPCSKTCDGRRNRTRDVIYHNAQCEGETCPYRKFVYHHIVCFLLKCFTHFAQCTKSRIAT